jgi:hypothetical protein
MEKIVCNPLNLDYRYQIKKSSFGNSVFREAADPTLVLFRDTYFLFVSMSGGFWYSDDLYSWQFKNTPELPIYDYAPDVREVNGALIFSASKRGEKCTFFRSENPLERPFEPISTFLAFWDPNVFQDDDGRAYFYWGCSNKTPIWGIEMEPKTMRSIGKKTDLFVGNEEEHGWERTGENNKLEKPKNSSEKFFRLVVGTKPFIEGAFMTKHDNKYYLQYAAPGTEYNIYGDGVYVSDHPLGPFTYQKHNPFSSKPGGFITAAGHGSTFQDKAGNWWHISSMRISVNERFERRLGLFPCDFDDDGILYCNQNFADYPFSIPEGKRHNTNMVEPDLMLLSYKASATASTSQKGYEPEKGTDENIRTWWAAEKPGDDEWFTLDLGNVHTANAIQLNFADHKLPVPELDKKDMHKEEIIYRLIMDKPQETSFLLESSVDGASWETIKDSRADGTDYAHDFIVPQKPVLARYVKVSHITLPFNGVPAISGLRVFGKGSGEKPEKIETVSAERRGNLDIMLSWLPAKNALGYNVRYGIEREKLYSSWQIYGRHELSLSTLNKGQDYYVAVDSFNTNGVTTGSVIYIPQGGKKNEKKRKTF